MNKIRSVNPATEETIWEGKPTSGRALKRMVNRARRPGPWVERTARERAECLRPLAALLRFHQEELARCVSLEMGKPIQQARHEIEVAARRVEAYCSQIPAYLEEEVLFEDDREKNLVKFHPMGVVAVISPWNAPVFLPLASLIPPLLCGNHVLFKPSEYTSLTGLRLAELIRRAGGEELPEEAFQVVLGDGQVGRRLVESEIDMVAFTGSVGTGKQVLRSCAGGLRRFVLELGGKDPALVLEDADLELAAREIVKTSTLYTGQVCFAVERVYCHRSLYAPFVEACVEETRRLVVGDPLQEQTDVGPFAVPFQLEKVLGHLQDALERGARLLCGGRPLPRPGYFLSPAVLVDVNHSMEIMREETFGPVTPIMAFEDLEEGIRLANDSRYGLTASVWTRDLELGEKVAARLQAGTVEVNRHGMSKPGCPWGGFKQSGIGRIYSKEGIREFTNIQHVWVVKG